MQPEDLKAVLAALDLPPKALDRWLADLEKFCVDHGGKPRYGELMALLEECRSKQ